MMQRSQHRLSRTPSTRSARIAHGLAALALASSSAACNFTEFDDFADDAPIRVYGAPKSYRTSAFGSVVTALRTGPSDQRSVVVASAGADSPVVFERMWNGSAVTSDTFTRCKGKSDCKNGTGVGAALIPFSHWAMGTQQEESGCIFAPGQPKAFVFCDSDTNANQSFALDIGDIASGDALVSFSGAGLPAGHPLGVVVLGAHAVGTRGGEVSRGRLFVQPDFQPPGAPSDSDEVPPLDELELTDPVTGKLFADAEDAGDLGASVALSADARGNLVLAVAQPSRARIIVASYEARTGKLATRACIESPAPSVSGFGTRLLVGDINRDDQPEIIVGTSAVDSAEQVWLYRGAGLPAEDPTACPGWNGAPIAVSCGGDLNGVRCDDSAFGAALALGDVDGDSFQDLIVGAPNARVDSADEAGAVWIFPGGTDSARDGGLDFDRVTNLVASKKARGHLGAAVAALHTQGRDEPVAGAPGEDRLYTFMCSELEGDVASRSLCLPK